MKAYIINLERLVERRQHVVAEAEKHGLDYEIVSAVDGGSVPSEEIRNLADMDAVSRNPEWLSDRILATSLSHRKVYEKIIADGVEIALVLEDDVTFFDNFATIADMVAEHLSGADVALLHFVSFEPLGLSSKNAKVLANGNKLVYPLTLTGVGSAAAYILTRDAAQNLFDRLIPLRTAPDSWNDFVDLQIVDRVRMLFPRAAGVVGAKSTIYVDSQTRFRSGLTEFVDKYRIPVAYSILRKWRLKNVERMSRFSITEEKSVFDREI
jgi:GR25 family glycosyltransferase involved in LPS biosynthesis